MLNVCCINNEEEFVTEPDAMQKDVAEEAKNYDVAFKFAGDAVVGVDSSAIDLSIAFEPRRTLIDLVRIETHRKSNHKSI